ncbi:MAG: hypothetical protein M3P51_14940, partial [Chloroflexota bacterium]|nr:hypothetical protein [Chloroflexota bacterium]
MVLRVPGMKRGVGIHPLGLVVIALLALLLLWVLYLAVDVWRAGNNMYQDIPVQARASARPEPRGTAPLIVFPMERPEDTDSSQASSTPAASQQEQPGKGTPEATTPPGVPTEYDASDSVPIPTQTAPVDLAQSSIADWNGKKRINVML